MEEWRGKVDHGHDKPDTQGWTYLGHKCKIETQSWREGWPADLNTRCRS